MSPRCGCAGVCSCVFEAGEGVTITGAGTPANPVIISSTASGDVTIRENSGADVGTRPRLNLIEGTNITLTVVDDAVDNEVDITIDSSGGGTAIPVQDAAPVAPALHDLWIDSDEDCVGGTSGATVAIKRVVRDSLGDISTTSTTRTPVDAVNLPYQVIPGLAVGDLIEVEFAAAVDNSLVGNATRFDVEVDRPASANTFVAVGNDAGFAEYIANRAASCIPVLWKATFIVTEAGDHGFRPVFFVSGGTGTIRNTASGTFDSLITFLVKKWPAAAVL